jgi:hypothetical protein
MKSWRNCGPPYSLYMVAADGSVVRGDSGRPAKASNDKDGYPCYWLQTNEGQYKPVRAHVLVAEAFLGPRPEGYQIHHKDEDKGNPNADNLEYLTRSEHRQEHASDVQGELGANAVLTEVHVLTIRLLVEHGAYQDRVAILFGVSKQNINDIIKRRSWGHI